MRTPEVRHGGRDDIAIAAALGASARDGISEESLRTHLSVYLASGGSILVADVDGRVLGFVLIRTVGPHLFTEANALIIDLLYVAPDARRRGMGHALISAVASMAGEVDSPYVYANSPATDRSTQRFLARLGFGPAAGHRVVATSVLLRRLADATAGSSRRDLLGRNRRENLDDLVARRRKAKDAGLPTGALDLTTLQSTGVN